VDEIGFVRLQEAEQRGEEGGFTGLAAKFICPDSGQVEEAPRPSLVAKRCR
jgi:hypothetical protein